LNSKNETKNTWNIVKMETGTSTKEIEEIIKPLKTKHSHGYDEIPTKILKLSALFISSSLTYICNKSLSSRIFPNKVKILCSKTSR
jgi:hypothetical protein